MKDSKAELDKDWTELNLILTESEKKLVEFIEKNAEVNSFKFTYFFANPIDFEHATKSFS